MTRPSLKGRMDGFAECLAPDGNETRDQQDIDEILNAATLSSLVRSRVGMRVRATFAPHLIQEGARGWSAGGRSEYAVTLSPSLVISDCWSPMDSIGVLKSDLSAAKDLFHLTQGKLREGSRHFPTPRYADSLREAKLAAVKLLEEGSVPSTRHYLDTGAGLAGLPEAAKWGTISPLGP